MATDRSTLEENAKDHELADLEKEVAVLKERADAAEGQAKFCEEEMDILQENLDAILMKQPKHPAEVNQEEMLAIVSGMRFGGYHLSGHVVKKVDQGVACQFRRDGETVHLNLKVPQVFVLDQFTPKTDKE